MGIVIVLVLILALVLYGISAYNKLAQERLKVDNQWSQIDIVLKQRSDTIPNLVQVVSAYAAHEKELLERISEARSRYMSAKSPDASVRAAADLSDGLSRLMAVAENYPELKSNANFMDLQKRLADLENKIADFRQFYNDTVMRYNRLIVTVPSSLIAKMFGFTQREFFRVEEAEKAAPEIRF